MFPLLWMLASYCLLSSLRIFAKDFFSRPGRMSLGSQRQSLVRVSALLQEIEETLMAGLVPTECQWAALKRLPDPWSTLVVESLQGLRSCGGALLPTLKRLRRLAEDQANDLGLAQSKTAQAFAQAWVCSMLVPILGFTLHFLLPPVQMKTRQWLVATGGGLFLATCGAVWLFNMTDQARWGGIQKQNRIWIFSSQCGGERFLAQVRAGIPPDLAWVKMCELLTQETTSLVQAWGYSIWDQRSVSFNVASLEHAIVESGVAIKKAIQLSLMEGRPCLERVETALLVLRSEIKIKIERELLLLSTRALKPLFIFVAPGLLFLLIYGVFLVAQDALGGGELSYVF